MSSRTPASGSTTSTVAAPAAGDVARRLGVGRLRQRDRERRAPPHLAGGVDAPPALADEREDGGQPQPGAPARRLGREVWLERARQRGGVHAEAGIGHPEHHRVRSAPVARLRTQVTGLHDDAPAHRHRVTSIHEQVHDGLLERNDVDVHPAESRLQTEHDVDALAEQRLQRPHHAGDDDVEVDELGRRPDGPRGGQDVAREVQSPHRCLANGLRPGAQRVGRVHALEHQLAVPGDHGEDVAEVVGHAAGQAAERLEPPGVLQLVLEPLPLRALLVELALGARDRGQRLGQRQGRCHGRRSAGGSAITVARHRASPPRPADRGTAAARSGRSCRRRARPGSR